ncbi:tumor necrosis factor receptor superfamily member 14-like isoform X1, partial [Lates japonicus]
MNNRLLPCRRNKKKQSGTVGGGICLLNLPESSNEDMRKEVLEIVAQIVPEEKNKLGFMVDSVHPGSRVKTDCTEFRSTSCLPCLDGTYMNQLTGLKHCFPCTNCDTGSGLKIKTSCTPTSDTVCEPLEGFYCIDSKDKGCVAAQRHKNCEPGQYISKKGTASTDTECSDCSDGTFSDGTFTSCQPHTQCESRINLQLIRPGNASADAECGEHSSNTTVTVISIVVPLSLIASVVIFIFIKRKCVTGLFSKNNEDNPPERHQPEEAREMVEHQQQQTCDDSDQQQ